MANASANPVKPRISLVCNTLNEERNLPNLLRSVQTWVDEIIVVDMHSEDNTVAIAQEFGAKVYPFERMGFCEPARKFAVEQATGDWILILDADEVVPEPLSKELIRIAGSGEADVVDIAWLNFIAAAPWYHTGWGPTNDRHMRFFRKGALIFGDAIHAGVHSAPRVKIHRLPFTYDHSVHHFSYLDWTHFLEKLNRYTTAEAEQAYARGERASQSKAIFQALFEFANRYVRHKGYRDGWRGFYSSAFMMTYRIAIHAKLQQMESVGGRAQIAAQYRAFADQLIAAYGPQETIAVQNQRPGK